MSAPGGLGHLTRRFFGSLRSRRPGPTDQAWVASVLPPAEAALFWKQPPIDQAHGVAAGHRAARAGAGPIVLRAALLHDVGKRHSTTGVLGRSMASGLALFHLPVRGRWRAYLEHGALGATDLEAAGSDSLIVEFARHHHDDRPAAIPDDVWSVLVAADHE